MLHAISEQLEKIKGGHQIIHAQAHAQVNKIDEMGKTITNLLKTVDILKGTVGQLNNRIKELESNQNTADASGVVTIPIQKDQDVLKTEIKTELCAEVDEKLDRQKRSNNLIFMNVPESDQGIKTAAKIMKVLLPSNQIQIRDLRLGPTKSKLRPRPLRIVLPSSYDRFLAIQNCKKLRSIDEFKNISVCKDLTKAEQMIEREKYEIRKSLKNNRNQIDSMDFS